MCPNLVMPYDMRSLTVFLLGLQWPKLLNAPLSEVDPELEDIIEHEKNRQWKVSASLKLLSTCCSCTCHRYTPDAGHIHAAGVCMLGVLVCVAIICWYGRVNVQPASCRRGRRSLLHVDSPWRQVCQSMPASCSHVC